VFGPRELGRLGQRLLEVVAPEQAERKTLADLDRAEQRAHHDRGLWLTDLPGSSRVRLTGWFDREAAAEIRAALDPLCAPRPASQAPARQAPARQAPARQGPGDQGSGGQRPGGQGSDLRSAAQRRADALVEVCRLATAGGDLPDNGGDRPQIVVTVDFDTLRDQIGAATLDDGALLGAATARRLACDAAIIPAVLTGTSQILDLGRERRLFTGPLRRALILRDRGCAFPTCDRPPRWCDGHHIVHWTNNGPTTLHNAVLLCGHHHRLVHHSDWQVHINPADGHPEFTPPPHIDPHQRPQRNHYHHRE
jgi:hypothetical protein